VHRLALPAPPLAAAAQLNPTGKLVRGLVLKTASQCPPPPRAPRSPPPQSPHFSEGSWRILR
jgi:hypothetical protein